MGPPFLEGPSDSHPTVQFSIAISLLPPRLERHHGRGVHGRAGPLDGVVPVGAHLAEAGLADAERVPAVSRLPGVGCTGKRPQSLVTFYPGQNVMVPTFTEVLNVRSLLDVRPPCISDNDFTLRRRRIEANPAYASKPINHTELHAPSVFGATP